LPLAEGALKPLAEADLNGGEFAGVVLKGGEFAGVVLTGGDLVTLVS
jgi:hypothetical protein